MEAGAAIGAEELVDALRRLEAVRREIVALRTRLAEIREARRILESRRPRTVFREVGSLVVEVTVEEALRYLEEEEELIRTHLSRLEAEEESLKSRIAKLERELGLRA